MTTTDVPVREAHVTGPGIEIRLARRPHGEPTPDDFARVEVAIPDIEVGQVLVRNDWMSVDPYMRGRMADVPSYVAPFELGAAMQGAAVGTVIASQCASLPVGTTVHHNLGWRTHAVLEEADAERVDTSRVDAPTYLGALGLNGITAYIALKLIAPVRADETVFISGAAGGVGIVAARVARHLGATRIIGSAGGPEKAGRLVSEFGYDAALDYKLGNVRNQLREAAPAGVDVYFDNVGGEHLRAAIACMRDFGRVALCGAISEYNNTQANPGPDNLARAISKRLSLRGFIAYDHDDLVDEYRELATDWIASGTLVDARTVVVGIDRSVEAFLGLSRGVNIGKMLVRL